MDLEKTQWLYRCYFKAQDEFCSPNIESGYEQDIIYGYLYHTRRLSALYAEESKLKNTLLCEYFLKHTFCQFLSAIQNTSLTPTFRQLCLDSIHNLLFELRKHYQNLPDGQKKYLKLKYQLQTIHI